MASKLFVEKVPNYVNGKWVESSAKDVLELTNPATGERLGSCPVGSASDVDAAVQAARAAFPAWSETPTPVRARHLFEIELPMLFLQGTRDDLAELPLLQPLVVQLGAGATLTLLEEADHSWHVPARTGRKDADVRAQALDTVSAWIDARLVRR